LKTRLFAMHARLVCGMFWRILREALPHLLWLLEKFLWYLKLAFTSFPVIIHNRTNIRQCTMFEDKNNLVQYISNKMQLYTVYYMWKLLYMFRVLFPPIIRSAYNCIYSIWYLSHRYCYLPLSWRRTLPR
jgi:hypothetical protein